MAGIENDTDKRIHNTKKQFLIPACVLAIIFELGAIFFLVQSMLTVFPKGESNWYLPLALGLNCIAMCLNKAQKKDSKVVDRKNERKLKGEN